ncbi:hypothetical protein I302_101812 [Kwoniella bestiolae CBS 10118]|uniref:chitin deacetylase n=1 Tax=Kwoniella bestiolae CBS 10118 TaxID=1296100 RepID=A0AAJ8K2Z3_9TREE
MYQLTAALTTLLLVAANGVQGHRGCAGHEVMRRNLGGPVITSADELRSLQLGTLKRRQVTDEASAAQSIGESLAAKDLADHPDPATECTAYSYQPIVDVKSSFPTIWETATLVNGDSEASSLFATINATVNSKLPNVKPKGTSTGDFSNVGYNASDPDCWWTWRGCTNPDSSLGVDADHTTVPEPDTWGLGFDDGPNCSHNAFYDHLQSNGQKATIYMTSFSNEQAFAELYYTRKAIKAVLGVTPTCWRPPYGDVDNRIRLIAQGLNLTNYVWSDDSEDWRAGAAGSNVTEADVAANYQSVVSKAANGTYKASGPMVLTHELTNFTMSEFMSQYDNIKGAFKYIVPLASAFNITQPYVENNVSYPDFLAYTNQTSTASSSSSASGNNPSGTANPSTSSTSNASSSSNSTSSAIPGVVINIFASMSLAGLVGCALLL